jgi:hypothetical protein
VKIGRACSVAAVAWLVVVPLAAAQQQGERTPQTDKTVPVARGARLNLDNQAGEVVIRTWDRDSLRVLARHLPRVTVDIQTTSNIVGIRSRGSGSVDYEITAPAWLPMKVSGQFLYIGIEGAQNEVSAETTRGDIVVKGGSGFVTAKSVHGEIILEDAKGKITASSINEGIRITGAGGEITADTTNGDIVLSKIQAKSVEAATVNGDIHYEGPVPASGQYRFTTHNGDITLTVPESSNATLSVRTYNGDFQTGGLPVKQVGDKRKGRRTTYILGTGGGAELEMESFGGDIRLRRPGAVPTRGKERAVPTRGKERDDHQDCSDQSARSATIGSTRAARSAGVAAAASAVAVSSVATAARIDGSAGLTR